MSDETQHHQPDQPTPQESGNLGEGQGENVQRGPDWPTQPAGEVPTDDPLDESEPAGAREQHGAEFGEQPARTPGGEGIAQVGGGGPAAGQYPKDDPDEEGEDRFDAG